MNKFIQNNLNIKLGDLVVIDGIDPLTELVSSSTRYDADIFKVVVIDSDESGEYIEIIEHSSSTDPSFRSNSDSYYDGDSFFRHTLSLVDSPKPLLLKDCVVGKKCFIGKKLDYLPYIESQCFTMRYSDQLTIRNSSLDKSIIGNIIFTISNVENGLVKITSIKYNITMYLPPIMLYSINPSSLYEPKNLIRD